MLKPTGNNWNIGYGRKWHRFWRDQAGTGTFIWPQYKENISIRIIALKQKKNKHNNLTVKFTIVYKGTISYTPTSFLRN